MTSQLIEWEGTEDRLAKMNKVGLLFWRDLSKAEKERLYFSNHDNGKSGMFMVGPEGYFGHWNEGFRLRDSKYDSAGNLKPI